MCGSGRGRLGLSGFLLSQLIQPLRRPKQNKTKQSATGRRIRVARNRAQAGEPRQCQEASHARNVRVKNERADDSEKQAGARGTQRGARRGGGRGGPRTRTERKAGTLHRSSVGSSFAQTPFRSQQAGLGCLQGDEAPGAEEVIRRPRAQGQDTSGSQGDFRPGYSTRQRM